MSDAATLQAIRAHLGLRQTDLGTCHSTIALCLNIYSYPFRP